MNAFAAVLLVAAGVAMVADWVAVWRRPHLDRAESVLKPLVMVLLVAVAVAIDAGDGGQRAWFVAALALSLAGDVFLLPAVDRFVPGLVSFLLAHVAYIAGFAAAGTDDGPMALAVIAVGLLALVAVRVLRAVRRTETALTVPVVVYMLVIAAMLVAAIAHGDWLGIAGAFAFVVSDSVLALDRFDRRRRLGPLVVMTTYHLAQALLVLSLVP